MNSFKQEIPPYNPPDKYSFAYWENFFSEEELNKILSLKEWDNVENAKIKMCEEGNGRPTIDSNLRRTNISWIDNNQDTKFIWDKLSLTIAEVNSRYFQFNLTGLYENIQLGCYKSESLDEYGWHVDTTLSAYGVMRKLSIALLLSDIAEFEGGDLELKPSSDTPVKLEQKKGRAWFFPSYMLHRVTPVTKGIRKSLVVWVGGPPFK